MVHKFVVHKFVNRSFLSDFVAGIISHANHLFIIQRTILCIFIQGERCLLKNA